MTPTLLVLALAVGACLLLCFAVIFAVEMQPTYQY